MFASGQQVHSVSSGSVDVVSVLISEKILFELSSKLALMSDKSFVKSTALIRGSPEKNHLLRQMTNSILRPATENLNTEEIFSRFIEHIALLMADSIMDPGKIQNPRVVEKLRGLCRAREYIEGHLDQPIQMVALCHYSSVSLS